MVSSVLNSTQSMLTDGSTVFFDSIIDTTKRVIDDLDYRYVMIMVSLLSIERILYSYFYIYPQHFMDTCAKGKWGKNFQIQTPKWKCVMTLSIYTKVFIQFPVAIYDILIYNTIFQHIVDNHNNKGNDMWSNLYDNIVTNPDGSNHFLHLLILGIVLLLIGQGLNVASYNALGNAGIYYGYELGYKLPYITNKFPYTTTVSKYFLKHPQYTGVLCSIWGIYMMIYSLVTAAMTSTSTATASSVSLLSLSFFLFPVVETFWYVASMKVLENPRGRNIMTFLGYPPMLMENEIEKKKKAQ